MDTHEAEEGAGRDGRGHAAAAAAAVGGGARGGLTGRAAAAESARQRVRDLVQRKIEAGGGHVVLTTRSIADELHVAPATVAHHLRALQQQGYLHTRSAGRRGLIISAGTPGRRSRRTVALTGRAAPRAGTRPFCPFCGARVQRAWRFCNACGEQIAR